MAYLLTRNGYQVDIFEKGPGYPYPPSTRFQEEILYGYENPAYRLQPDLQNLTVSGDYPGDLDKERALRVGGTATHWGAETPRMHPGDFATRSRYGFGDDWALTYDDLEPYYCEAERLLGVSGTDADNPFAPRRSRPYPLPPFELTDDDRFFAERLHEHGIVLHTTPQARTRHPYEQRPACMNFGACEVCPIGARYHPNYHLGQIVATGLCRLHANTSVRRLIADKAGRVRGLVYQPNDALKERELGANVIIVAAGAIESARLLLLSSLDRHSDGIQFGPHLGQNLMLHHAWYGRFRYKDALSPKSLGPQTGTSHQFLDPPGRGRHGGIKVNFSDDFSVSQNNPPIENAEEATSTEIVERFREMRHWRTIGLQGETTPSPRKFVTLSQLHDRFGDPFAHVHYESTEFDHETYRFARQVFGKFAAGTNAQHKELQRFEYYLSNAHHMGTCRMGPDLRDGVVDRFGRVHGTPNLFVIGGSCFASSGALQPTLTMVALAVRSSVHIIHQAL